MRRPWPAALLAAPVLLGLAAAPAGADEASQGFDPEPVGAPVEPLSPGAPAPCGRGSWVAGSVEVCAGEVVYRDYVYDDFGATQLGTTFPRGGAYGFLPPAGAQQEGQPAERRNTTDLVALRLRRDGGAVAVDAELNTLVDRATTRVVVAVDRDADPATGGGPLPGLVADPQRGTTASIRGWDELVELACDAATNRCAGAFTAPPGAVTVWALAARAGDGAVMNVAFRGTDETGFWWESHQASAIAGGDLSAYGLRVEPADLDPATTRRFETPRGRVLQRVYVSAHPLGEGVSDDGVPGPGQAGGNPLAGGLSQAFNLLGRYQPYGFYLPRAAGPHGVQLVLHGLAENHSGRLYFPSADGSFAANVGEARNRILVAPLGRGWRNWWSSYGERDAWDALGDAIANHDVDPSQRFVSGYSMGGYGTLRLGSLYPDLWAGALNWVGWTGDLLNGTPAGGQFADGGSSGGAVGNALDLVANLRHVPIANVYGGADELVHVHQALALRSELARLRVPSMFWLHPSAEHVSPMLADDWTKESDWSAGRTLERSPATVTFRTDERLFLPDLGLVPDHAYWVWSVDPAGPGYADVEARTLGCGGAEPAYEVREGVGPLDPPPLLASVSQEVAEVGRVPVPVAPRVEVSTRNVASLAVDAGGACLGPGPVDYVVRSDGPLVLRLTDGRTLTVPGAGEWSGTLAAVADLAAARPGTGAPSAGAGAAGAPPPAAGPAALARTGSTSAVPAATALLALALGARRLAAPGSAGTRRRRYGP